MAKKTSKSTKRKASAKATTRKNRSQKAKPSPIVVDEQVEVTTSAMPPLSTDGKLPNVIQIAKRCVDIIWDNKKLFIAICVTYGILNLILVQGLANGNDVSSLKSDITKGFHGHIGSLFSSVGVFAVLLSSSGNSSSQTAGAYQIFLFIIISLAIIWTLRQIQSGHKVRMRQAFYQGMSPLIPFLLVLAMFCLQLIPVVVGSGVYGLAISSATAINLFEKSIFFVIFLLTVIWSGYLTISTLFAFYIVTLPDMTPLKALRSAKQLVKKRRLLLLRKMIGLPIMLLLVTAAIMTPIILLATGLAQWIFFILTTITLLIIHTYMYTLYRELLNE